jgi:DNA-binding Lrp family transcriptional regulator
VLGIGGLLGGASGGEGVAGQQQGDEQEHRGQHGHARGEHEGDDHAHAGEQNRRDLAARVELAQRVGLTTGPCLRRVQRLEADGVIRGYRAVIDPAAVGRIFEVLIDLTLDAQDAETVERFEETLAQADEVIELRRLFGSPDYFVRVAGADLAAYETFLSTRVMTIPRIKNVISHFTMKNVKPAP